MKSPYIPINCSLYDQLEAFAVKRTIISVSFETTLDMADLPKAAFVNFKTEKDGEYGIISTPEGEYKIRLDFIKKLNGIAVKDKFGGSCSLPKNT